MRHSRRHWKHVKLLGAEVGVPAPVNEVVSALVRGLEEKFG